MTSSKINSTTTADPIESNSIDTARDKTQDRAQGKTEQAEQIEQEGAAQETAAAKHLMLAARTEELAQAEQAIPQPGVKPAELRASVQILLPDAADRRIERWTDKVPGASWPGWGGHITLVPPFVPSVPADEVYQRLLPVCQNLSLFRVRLAEPVAVQDATRPGYCAVFLTVNQTKDIDHNRLMAAYTAVNAAVSDMMGDTHAGLAEQPFLPHVTLALGIGEAEAARMVRNLKAEPIEAKFLVDELTLVLMYGQGSDRRVEKRPLPLGPPKPIGLLSD